MSTEPPIAQASLYAARPSFLLNGQRCPAADELLVCAEVHEERDGLAHAELRFADTVRTSERGIGWAFETEGGSPLSLGMSVRLFMGDETSPQEIFQGIISAVEISFEPAHPPELLVFAEDALWKARMRRRTRTYTERTLGGLVETIAAELGLRPRVSGLDQDPGTQVQINETDLGFLRRVLERFDGWMKISGQELEAGPWSQGSLREITLELHSLLKSVRVTADLADQVSAVTYSGWDAVQGAVIHVESNGALPLGPGTGRTGTQVLEEAFGPRREHAGSFVTADDREARALVDSLYLQRARRFVIVDGCAAGHPGLRVGTRVRLQGLGPRFDNTYTVTRTCHRFDLINGYETDFEAEGARFGG